MKSRYNREMRVIASQLGNPFGKRGEELGREMHEKNGYMIERTLANLEIQAGNKVLELGHGSALHVPNLMKIAEGITYQGLEISQTMKDSATANTEKTDFKGQAAFALYNGEEIPFREELFDRVFTVNTIYFWSNPQLLASEIKRVLKPGGLLAVTFANREFMKRLPFTQFGFELYEPEELSYLMLKSGLTESPVKTQSDVVVSASGELVTREFMVMLFRKS